MRIRKKFLFHPIPIRSLKMPQTIQSIPQYQSDDLTKQNMGYHKAKNKSKKGNTMHRKKMLKLRHTSSAPATQVDRDIVHSGLSAGFKARIPPVPKIRLQNGLSELHPDVANYFTNGPPCCSWCKKVLNKECRCRKEKPAWDMRFGDSHFWWNIVGETKSGKTTLGIELVKNILIDRDTNGNKSPNQFFVRKILISPLAGKSKHAFPADLFDITINTRAEMVAQIEDIMKEGEEAPNTLVVCDDVVTFMRPNFFDAYNQFATLFRHCNTSVMNLAHYYKQILPMARDQALMWTFFKPSNERCYKSACDELHIYKLYAPKVDWDVKHENMTVIKYPGPKWIAYKGSNFEYLGDDSGKIPYMT